MFCEKEEKGVRKGGKGKGGKGKGGKGKVGKGKVGKGKVGKGEKGEDEKSCGKIMIIFIIITMYISEKLVGSDKI